MNRRSMRTLLAPALALAGLTLLSPALRAGPEPLDMPGENGTFETEQLQLPFETGGLISPLDASLSLSPRLGLLSVMAPFAPGQLGSPELSPLRPVRASNGSWRIAADGLQSAQTRGAPDRTGITKFLKKVVRRLDAHTGGPSDRKINIFLQSLSLFDGAAVLPAPSEETDSADNNEQRRSLQKIIEKSTPGRVYTEDALQKIALEAGLRRIPTNIGHLLDMDERVMHLNGDQYLFLGLESLDEPAASETREAVSEIRKGRHADAVSRLARILEANPRLKEPAALYRNACIQLLHEIIFESLTADEQKRDISDAERPGLSSVSDIAFHPLTETWDGNLAPAVKTQLHRLIARRLDSSSLLRERFGPNGESALRAVDAILDEIPDAPLRAPYHAARLGDGVYVLGPRGAREKDTAAIESMHGEALHEAGKDDARALSRASGILEEARLTLNAKQSMMGPDDPKAQRLEALHRENRALAINFHLELARRRLERRIAEAAGDADRGAGSPAAFLLPLRGALNAFHLAVETEETLLMNRIPDRRMLEALNFLAHDVFEPLELSFFTDQDQTLAVGIKEHSRFIRQLGEIIGLIVNLDDASEILRQTGGLLPERTGYGIRASQAYERRVQNPITNNGIPSAVQGHAIRYTAHRHLLN